MRLPQFPARRTRKHLEHTNHEDTEAATAVGLVLFLGLFFWVGAHAQITPLGDSYTNSSAPTVNYGAKTLLDVDGATQTTYIQFDLASIPSGASVSQATLKLYVNGVTTAGSFNAITWKRENSTDFDQVSFR